MKTTIKTLLVAMAFFIAGCNDLPKPDEMTIIANGVGKAAALAADFAKLKPEAKEAINQVLDVLAKVVPESGKTFVEAWTPVAEAEIDKLISAGKLNASYKPVIMLAVKAACTGIDYVFVKYPKAKDVEELVAATITGFIDGYKSIASVAATENVKIDEEAYKYIKKNM